MSPLCYKKKIVSKGQSTACVPEATLLSREGRQRQPQELCIQSAVLPFCTTGEQIPTAAAAAAAKSTPALLSFSTVLSFSDFLYSSSSFVLFSSCGVKRRFSYGRSSSQVVPDASSLTQTTSVVVAPPPSFCSALSLSDAFFSACFFTAAAVLFYLSFPFQRVYSLYTQLRKPSHWL
jgi:hypothetical protein